MRDIYFISDTHFSHDNILAFRKEDGTLVRPGFASSEDMDEQMIEKWNTRVAPTDLVYHLGDLGFQRNTLDKIMPRLNGHKRLIMGNHDTFDVRFYRQHFQKIGSWRLFNEGDAGFLCTHFPLHPSTFSHKSRGRCVNVHGHVHQNTLDDPRYVNISVEVIDYTPVHYDELLQKSKELK